jgi:plasmid stability protein
VGASRTIDFFYAKSHSFEMSEKDQYPSDAAERFQVRLPPGLRDRIKAYAERHGRSMNTEIVRVLEREFPEPWTIAGRVGQMIEMLRALKAGSASDEHIEKLVEELRDTVEGIMSGRVQGVDEEMRDRITGIYKDMQAREVEDSIDLAHYSYDDEEIAALQAVERPEKYPHPPMRKKHPSEMTEDELRAWATSGKVPSTTDPFKED